jgi:hypothetical protein
METMVERVAPAWSDVRTEARLKEPQPIKKKQTFEEAVAECGGITVKEFFDEVRQQVREAYAEKRKKEAAAVDTQIRKTA